MIKLNRGDKIAVVSLSSGILGENFCSHQLKIGTERLKSFGFEVVFMENSLKGLDYVKNNPKKRAEDLLNAFRDKEIKGIFCAIGGDDTFKIAPHILNDEAQKIIKQNPKFFIGYSDSTIDHLMLYKLGINTFYGLSFLTCFAELGNEMLEYSKKSFENIFTSDDFEYFPSKVWYEEREDFSELQVGVERVSHIDEKGYELLQGRYKFSGKLIGGCLESLYDLIVGERYPEERKINEEYKIFPNKDEFRGKVLFLETSEERPDPTRLEKMLRKLNEEINFENLSGILVGKPQNEVFYEDYKSIYKKIVDKSVPVIYNVNFGHAYPKIILQYGANVIADAKEQRIVIERI